MIFLFKISDIKHLKYDDEEGELEIGQVASLFRQQQSVAEVMKETGNDLPSLYKETSEGGLAKDYKPM